MTNPIKVEGAWRLGWALDVHTTSSAFLGYDEFGHARYDTTRSPLGELLFQLKYRQQNTAGEVADIMAAFLADKPNAMGRVDLIVPMPASTTREVQPVTTIARELGKRVNKAVAADIVRKARETPELKDIREPDERRDLLDGAFEVDGSRIKGKGVLLIDDLYRSGATANAVTLSLLTAGAVVVYLLAGTRTRSRT